MPNELPLYLDGSAFEPTSQNDVFVFRGQELVIVTACGRHYLCKDGDRIRVEETGGCWWEIVEVIPAPLH